MSLQVWLPMTEDLRNQGLSDVTITNYGATLNAVGKLGGCYYFDGVDDRITIKGLTLSNVWSYGCWVYADTSTRGWEGVIVLSDTGSDGVTQMGFLMYPDGNRIQNTANGQWNSQIGWTYGSWHHFFGTFDGSSLKTYIDGELINTKNITASLISRVNLVIGARTTNIDSTGASLFFQGKISDVRIYDHCLSPMEVKRISQGLILHYPLNNMGFGQENLIKNTGEMPLRTSSVKGFRASGGVVSHLNYSNLPVGTGVIRITNTGTSAASVGMAQDILTGFIAGKKYSESAWVRASTTVTNARFQPVWISSTQTTGQGNHFTITTEWQYFKTEGLTLNGTQASTYSSAYIYGTVPANGWIEVCGMKVEEGDKATPWSPAPSDTLADTMGLNSNIEYDSSGYCHNANRASGHDNLLLSDPKGYVPSAYNAYSIWMSENLKANQTYTIQFWDVNVSHSAKSAADLGIDVYWGGGSIRLKYWHGTSYFTNGHADYLVGTFTVTDAQASGSGSANSWLNLYNSVGNADGTRSMSIGKWKLEKGSVATSWTPGSYKSYTTDSPKYSVSAEFDGVDSATVSPIFDSTTRHSELTTAAWVKRTSDDANWHYYWHSQGISLDIRPYNSVNNYYNVNWTHATDSSSSGNGWINNVMPLNTWVHDVWVFDHGVMKHYVNGELTGTSDRSSTGTYILGDVTGLMGGQTSTSNMWQGGLSDFRIYATALSATDIKSLYQNSATIDADGTIHGAIR